MKQVYAYHYDQQIKRGSAIAESLFFVVVKIFLLKYEPTKRTMPWRCKQDDYHFIFQNDKKSLHISK
jgi:hypothetical protein